MMTSDEQKKFINEILIDFRKEVERDIEKIPREWSGRQLRQYLSDRFTGKMLSIKMSRSELREYKEQLTNSLL